MGEGKFIPPPSVYRGKYGHVFERPHQELQDDLHRVRHVEVDGVRVHLPVFCLYL